VKQETKVGLPRDCCSHRHAHIRHAYRVYHSGLSTEYKLAPKV